MKKRMGKIGGSNARRNIDVKPATSAGGGLERVFRRSVRCKHRLLVCIEVIILLAKRKSDYETSE